MSAVAFYSWPSQGSFSLLDYHIDENNIDWTVPHLKSFLEELRNRSGASTIHVIAHSMGSRALARALWELAAERPNHGPYLDHIILNAPDIDADVFRYLAQRVLMSSRQTTMYVSDRDKALRLSRMAHGYQRAGEVMDAPVVIDGVDTIDVSAVDNDLGSGHSYYADNRTVLSDIFSLIRYGKPPDGRFGMKRERGYWAFRP
jgi:esterase/lipase superfamily enzyme